MSLATPTSLQVHLTRSILSVGATTEATVPACYETERPCITWATCRCEQKWTHRLTFAIWQGAKCIREHLSVDYSRAKYYIMSATSIHNSKAESTVLPFQLGHVRKWFRKSFQFVDGATKPTPLWGAQSEVTITPTKPHSRNFVKFDIQSGNDFSLFERTLSLHQIQSEQINQNRLIWMHLAQLLQIDHPGDSIRQRLQTTSLNLQTKQWKLFQYNWPTPPTPAPPRFGQTKSKTKTNCPTMQSSHFHHAALLLCQSIQQRQYVWSLAEVQ